MLLCSEQAEVENGNKDQVGAIDGLNLTVLITEDMVCGN